MKNSKFISLMKNISIYCLIFGIVALIIGAIPQVLIPEAMHPEFDPQADYLTLCNAITAVGYRIGFTLVTIASVMVLYIRSKICAK